MSARVTAGISVHTGWAACVVVAGSLASPRILANRRLEILGDDERFCYHLAAGMRRQDAADWLMQLRDKAIANAGNALAPLAGVVEACAIVASDRDVGPLDAVLASHARIHAAEGCFYRDVLRAACPVPVCIVAPASLDPATVGRLAPPPWGKDQRMATLAALRAVPD
jgi:hypothetical protein